MGGVRDHEGSRNRVEGSERGSYRRSQLRKDIGPTVAERRGKRMAEQDRAPVSLDDSDSTLRSDERARRLCIVSRKPLLCGPFMAALRTVLTPHDELEIIVDRRRERLPTEARPDAEQPSIERRRHPQVDRHLKFDGFAIVPALAAGLKAQRGPISLLPSEVPVEEVWPEDLKDEERLESMRIIRRKHVGWLTAWLVLAGLMSAVVVLLAPSSAVKTLVSRLRLEASSSESLPVPRRQDKQISPEVHAPSATANPAEVQRPGLPEASSPVRGEHSPADAAREFPVTGGASETRAAARVAPKPRATASPRQISNVTTSPIADTSPPDAVTTRITSPRFLGLPRVEVVGTTAAAWGHGETYGVRISDPAGRPVAGAEVLLRARMADGTVQSIFLNSGPEPGTYQATVPGGSAPVDLRVSVMMSGQRVEIPLSP